MLVGDIVRRNSVYHADRDAVVVPGGVRLSWAEVEKRSNRLAHGFRELGLVKGDRVVLTAPNCAEFVEFYFACAKSGVIGVTTNVRLTAEDLAKYMRLVAPGAVIAHTAVGGLVRGYLELLGGGLPVVGIGSGAEHGFELDYDALLAAQSDQDPGIDVKADDVYQLGATSGTTGTPKAAILTHHNAIAAELNWMAELQVQDAATALQCIPMFFNPGGPANLHPALMKGGRTVIMPAFDPSTFLRLVPEYGVQYTILVPTMLGMVLSHSDCFRFDLSSLRGIMSGGSPMPAETLSRAKQVIGGDVIRPIFGMAETYSCGLILRPEYQVLDGTEEEVRRLSSAGKPMVLMQVRVVSEDGCDVALDNQTPGELWLKGDTVAGGYYGMPEETAASREGEWLKTGDVGVMDADGFVTIVDRKKDIIISGGINVFSRDIEEVLFGHPAVLFAAAIGVPHEVWGESVHAVVQLRPGHQASTEGLMAFAAERLASYKKPRSLEIVESMPISATGKILKTELRAKHWAGRKRRVG